MALLALLALIISVVPFGISWAEPGNGNGRADPPAHGRDKEDEDRTAQEEQDEAAEQEAGDDEPADDAEPSPAGDGGPYRSRRSSSPSQQDSAEATAAEAQGDVIDVSFSASPASIAVGETSTLQAAVSNPGPDPVRVEVLVDLPAHLEVASTDPPAPSSGVLELALGDLAPGATATATVVVLGLDRPGEPEPVRFAVTADDQTFHHELLVTVDQDDAEGLGLVQSSPLLIQVGDASTFSATLSNNGQTALQDVAVMTEIAPELDVVGVEPIAEADAIQLGASPKGEDIVWIFESLEPGEEAHLTWTAQAVAPGDLEAANDMRATVGGQPAASSQQQTYLGFVRGIRTDRSAAADPIVRERVVTKLVPVSTEVAGSAGGGILPVTGWSPGFLGFGGVLLIGLGALILWVARGPRSRRLALVFVGMLLLTATACVSDQDPPQADGPSPIASPSPEATPDEEEQDDQVLGLRIKRPKPVDAEPQAPGDPADPVAVAEPVTEVVYEEVSEVVSVVVPVAELPLETLAPRAGDNAFSFSWNPGSAADLSATSGRVISADATEEVLVALSSEGDRLAATVTVANLADERRLHVDGSLVLDIVSADGRSSSLVSEPIDVVLEPGATTAADLTFSLPAGSYSAKGAFVTD